MARGGRDQDVEPSKPEPQPLDPDLQSTLVAGLLPPLLEQIQEHLSPEIQQLVHDIVDKVIQNVLDKVVHDIVHKALQESKEWSPLETEKARQALQPYFIELSEVSPQALRRHRTPRA